MKYKIAQKGRLEITDSEINKSFSVPKKFNYLKITKDGDEKYQFALCNKSGKLLSNYKKYNEIDDKFKYINTRIIDEIDLDELYDEEHIFSVKPSETHPEAIIIFSINDEDWEIGVLSDDVHKSNYDIPYQNNNLLPPQLVQDHEKKIIMHPSTRCSKHEHVTMLDILKAYSPDAFNGDGSFKYLNKIDDIDLKVSVEFKNSPKHNPDSGIAGFTNHPNCLTTHGKNRCNTHDYYFTLDSKQEKGCDLRKLLLDDNSMQFFIGKPDYYNKNKPVMFISENGFSMQITDKSNGKIIFENHLNQDIPVYDSNYML